ncbi:MAG: hypothetical protein K6B28_13020, partial [Lachnospiraceae bacterium]|nr:hypothetical protein [Lachnospiraceae bacterium]
MKNKKINSFELFLIISLAGEFLYFIILLFSGEKVAAWLAMENNFDYSFTDHFRHIAFASDMKHFYFNTQDATFPPFAYMLYYLLYKINPGTFGVKDWKIVRDYKYNMLIFIMLVVITVLLFKLIVDKILDRYSSEKRFL